VVLIGALILTTIASLLIDIPAAALGATVTGSHISPGIQIADTFIQDVCFVLVSIWFAQLGGRKVASWQFGLRRPPRGWWRAIGLIGLLIACFLVLIAVWQEAFNPSREKLLEELGTNEGAALLVLSAALTCIVAPISEEFLFRGYIFTALRNWRGTLPAALITGLIFGGVHAGSAPALDLIPLVGSASGCACCTATPARCTRASPPTRSTTASRSGASRDGTGRCRC
jgi:membrane protease YdiL (CAAX protease family)